MKKKKFIILIFLFVLLLLGLFTAVTHFSEKENIQIDNQKVTHNLIDQQYQIKEKQDEDLSVIDHDDHKHDHVGDQDHYFDENFIEKSKIIDTVTEVTADELNLDQFNQLTSMIYQALGTKDDLKELSDQEVHHIPPVVTLAGHGLGHLREILAQRPEFSEEAQHFYDECVQDELLVDSIRALCLTHMGLNARNNDLYFDIDAYPKNLQRLANLILQMQD